MIYLVLVMKMKLPAVAIPLLITVGMEKMLELSVRDVLLVLPVPVPSALNNLVQQPQHVTAPAPLIVCVLIANAKHYQI